MKGKYPYAIDLAKNEYPGNVRNKVQKQHKNPHQELGRRANRHITKKETFDK